MRKKRKLTKKGQRIQVLSIQTSVEYSNGEDLITSTIRKYGRDRNHKLWMSSFVLYSQQRFYLVRKSTILLFICRQYPNSREMVSLHQNRHSLSGILLYHQFHLIRWWCTVLVIFDSPSIWPLFFFLLSMILYCFTSYALHIFIM